MKFNPVSGPKIKCQWIARHGVYNLGLTEPRRRFLFTGMEGTQTHSLFWGKTKRTALISFTLSTNILKNIARTGAIRKRLLFFILNKLKLNFFEVMSTILMYIVDALK